ncbi:ribonuclease h1 [Plakobranchus ocellatus]|uniref:Ribonuclease h1 n=1 Tax=Plakobranchus ocellatus TaxID=259542 RepID=A0AAV4DX89_9GAST|nr:ribonuclease h1 [Plakobranchus ocellatus]
MPQNFVIYSDSLSALQALQSKNFKVIDIKRLHNLIRKFPPYVHISFVWIPAHVGIQGSENVDKLAKGALNRALGYLLKNEERPFCYACDSLYIVRHILIECLYFQDTRRKYFSVTDLYKLF